MHNVGNPDDIRLSDALSYFEHRADIILEESVGVQAARQHHRNTPETQ